MILPVQHLSAWAWPRTSLPTLPSPKPWTGPADAPGTRCRSIPIRRVPL